jgi:hypothetical protein
VTSGEAATVRTYTAPDDGFPVTSHVIELPAQLVVVDAQCALPYAREIVDDAKGLDKPLARLYIGHERTRPPHSEPRR